MPDVESVNSLLAIAVFVGISLASPDQHGLENRPECDADPGLEMRLVLFEVVSFGLFILSTLVAKATKVHINIHRKEEFSGTRRRYKYARGCLLLLSAIASFVGVVFLTLSMVDVIQIKIGKLSCGSQYAFLSVASLCGITIVAMLVYSVTAGHAIYLSITYGF
ncbi:uncharacterized protein LOC119991582 [Tripterygium wilfordii]|uniref:uncharacterized protein LOC119991582 n=1 Tax=Tripterygium wilfordii TaxID=458696 RepID=UPI0018F84646|nr:uncharacterized protein LOC119991582 [Tripterygium wilfordii]